MGTSTKSSQLTLRERLLPFIGDEPYRWARKHGISKATLHNVLEKNGNPRGDQLLKISKAIQRPIEWLLTGEDIDEKYCAQKDIDDEFDLVPMAETKLNAGGGSVVISENFKESYAFRKDWISRIATSRNNIYLMQVEGDSMEPLIADGDTVMIDAGRKTIHTGRIYALGVSDAIMVKRLELLPDGQIRIISVNPAYSPYIIGCTPAETSPIHHTPLNNCIPQKDQAATPRILGQVIWFARQLVRDTILI